MDPPSSHIDPATPTPDAGSTSDGRLTQISVRYRCVCGKDVDVNPEIGGACGACGRSIKPDVLRGDLSQTVCIPATGSSDGQTSVRVREGVDDAEFIGKMLGHYRVVNRLGQGGMGAVFRALDESLQRYVAIKVLGGSAGSTTSGGGQVHQLLEEARSQARVNHANVVHIYYVSRDEETPFLAMELVDGPTLAEVIAGGRLRFPDIVDIAAQTSQALAHAARFDIVHGDIKPSNVLIAGGRQVKLSDFGLSQRISRSGETTKIVRGTPNYMAPESCEGASPSPQTDQYSLGVMLFEMTFGKPPYHVDGDSLTKLTASHRDSRVEYPQPWPKHVPDEWRAVLVRLLQKNPEARFASHDDLVTALEAVRPLDLPQAGRLSRATAWNVDMLLFGTLTALLSVPLENSIGLRTLGPRGILLLLLVPFLVAWIQARFGTTPAKKLFQIRIVDDHGLRPASSVLALRSFAQFSGISLLCLTTVMQHLGLISSWGWLLAGVGIVTGLVFVADCVPALFARGARSLHDRLLGTRVCLDAGNTGRRQM